MVNKFFSFSQEPDDQIPTTNVKISQPSLKISKTEKFLNQYLQEPLKTKPQKNAQ
jgi:hypothetical protein